MKHTVLAIFSLGVIGLSSGAPAGGWYGPGPFPGGPGGGGLPKPTRQICNCNDPSTKQTAVEPLCKGVGGEDRFQRWTGLDPIDQHMCLMSVQITDVFTNENCRKQFGASYNSYCNPYY